MALVVGIGLVQRAEYQRPICFD